MTDTLQIPTPSHGGIRQLHAAQLRAEMEARLHEHEQEDKHEPIEQSPDDSGSPQQEQRDTERPDQQGTGPVGQGDYVVKEGDCIGSIAANSGHFWETVWNDSANAELQQVRQDPNVLLPGDRVTVPPLREKQEPAETEMRHRFVRLGEPSQLQIQVLWESQDPRANEPYILEIDDEKREGVTDAAGYLRASIPPNARRAKLTFIEDDTTYDLTLGKLDPLTESSGVQGRLTNLGFDCGSSDGVLGPRTRDALRSFQHEQGLPETGELDEKTRAKLGQVHGS